MIEKEYDGTATILMECKELFKKIVQPYFRHTVVLIH